MSLRNVFCSGGSMMKPHLAWPSLLLGWSFSIFIFVLLVFSSFFFILEGLGGEATSPDTSGVSVRLGPEGPS